jgi:superfamily II DNA or RNA helicase
MFLNSALYDYIGKHLGFKETKAGLTLVKNGHIKEVFHNNDQNYIEVVLEDNGRHSVVIEYANAFSITRISMLNSTPNQVYVSAALQYLISKSDAELNIVRVVDNQSVKREKLKGTTKNNPKPVDAFQMPDDSPQTKRKLPNGYLSNFTHFLQINKSGFSDLIRNITHKLSILPNSIIRGELIVNQLYKDPAKVNVDFCIKVNEAHTIRCSECESGRKVLCPHQYYFFNTCIDRSMLSNLSKLDYDTIRYNYLSDKDLSNESFEKLYEIELTSGTIKVNKKIKSFQDKTGLVRISDKVRDFGVSRNSLLHEVLVQEQGKEVGENIKNIFLWLSSSLNESETLLLMETKVAKASNRITGAVNGVNFPSHLSPEEKELYFRIYQLGQRYKNAPALKCQTLLATLQNELETVRGIYHYYSSSFYYNKNTLIPFQFQQSPVKVSFKIVDSGEFYVLTRKVFIDETPLLTNFEIFETFILVESSAYLYKDINQYYALLLQELNEVTILKEEKNELDKLVISLMQSHDVDLPADFELDIIQCHNGIKEINISEAGDFLIFNPFLRYDESLKFNLLSENFTTINGDHSSTFFQVDEDEKAQFLHFMKSANPLFEHSFGLNNSFLIHIKDFIKETWFFEFFELCKLHDITIFGQENLNNFRFNTNQAFIKTSVTSGIDWFDVDVKIEFGNTQVAARSWIEALRNNEKFVKLDDGTYGIIPDEWVNKLKRIALSVDIENDKLTLSKYKFGVVDELFEEISDDRLFLDMQGKIYKLTNYTENTEFKLPAIITADLRPYQLEGYQWLKSLDETNFGGCLADDMGLGKTLEMICLLAAQKEENKGSSIVVAPRSLLFNWAAEIEKFCPSLTYILYHGNDRANLKKSLLDYDVVITTYDTTSIDIEFLRELRFNYAILDESQAIKNPNSKRYKAVRLLNTRNKMVMTGTPLENNTFDLYAQFTFVNPGILGSVNAFKDRFSIPIDKYGDQDATSLLKKIISPFFLRRTKEVVAKDLPEKTENIIYCEMEPVQRKMYDELKVQIRKDIESDIKIQGINKSKFKILEALLRLRQLCNAPALLDKTLPDHKKSSVKVNTLVDIFKNDLGSHNALVFSQFTSMLDIIRRELDKEGIKYAYLDGATRDRKGAVDSFQDNEDINIFLISLKAGNTGLNLVKADYVYIVDPWWNPAVEAQAIDRTHRIGQDKHIFAYRMICKDTIEEKILALQQKKKKIAQDLIATDENIFKSLNKQELIDLFS